MSAADMVFVVLPESVPIEPANVVWLRRVRFYQYWFSVDGVDAFVELKVRMARSKTMCKEVGGHDEEK